MTPGTVCSVNKNGKTYARVKVDFFFFSFTEGGGLRSFMTTREMIEVHHFFSEVPHIASLRPLPKTDLDRVLKLLPDEKSDGVGIQRESCEKNNLFPTILV